MSSIFPESTLYCSACGKPSHEMDWAAHIMFEREAGVVDDLADAVLTPHMYCPECGAKDTAFVMKEEREQEDAGHE